MHFLALLSAFLLCAGVAFSEPPKDISFEEYVRTHLSILLVLTEQLKILKRPSLRTTSSAADENSSPTSGPNANASSGKWIDTKTSNSSNPSPRKTKTTTTICTKRCSPSTAL